MTNADIIAWAMHRESGGKPATATGLVNNPADRGGPTSIWGITQASLERWRRRAVTVAEVGQLTYDEARSIYIADYILGPGFGLIVNPWLRWAVVDANINHTPVLARKLLQRALKVGDDGMVGAQTRRAIALTENQGVKPAIRVCTARQRLYAAIVQGNLADRDRDGVPDNVEFLGGWTDRAADMIEELLEVAA